MAFVHWSHDNGIGFTTNWVYDTTQNCWYQVFDDVPGAGGWPARIADADNPAQPRITLYAGNLAGERAILSPILADSSGVGIPLTYVPCDFITGEGPKSYFASHVGSLRLHRWGTRLSNDAAQYGLTKVLTMQRDNGPGYDLVLNGYAVGTYNPSSSDIDKLIVHAT